jgi:hypothetical protein
LEKKNKASQKTPAVREVYGWPQDLHGSLSGENTVMLETIFKAVIGESDG